MRCEMRGLRRNLRCMLGARDRGQSSMRSRVRMVLLVTALAAVIGGFAPGAAFGDPPDGSFVPNYPTIA